MFNFFKNKKVAEKLYEQNLELSVKNKTLSLLEKLYQASVLTLTPEEMAQQITDTIRTDLNFEMVGILVFDKEKDELTPLAFSKSERLVQILKKLGFLFRGIIVKGVSTRPFFKKVIYDKSENVTNNIEEVWDELISAERLEELKSASNIKTVLVRPLIIEGEIFGVFLMGFNREYETLNDFERSSMRNFTNVIALLLDRAYLYKNLQHSYAVEKKAKEELQNLDATKNQFLLTIQHHLRTPLTSMMGYSDLLINGAFGKQPKKTIEVIKKFQTSTQNLIKMVNNFLDITQFQLGKDIVMERPGVELGPIVDEIVTDLRFQAEKKGLKLNLEKPTKMMTIKADREKLKAALQNIFDNAVKYTPKGKVTITVANGTKTIKITVVDTGIGIPKEKIENLFSKPFERGEEAKKTFAVGSGIGLYLAAQIIKAHGGLIFAESEGMGLGSTFHIELPIE